jgi:hypothetical protein
VAFGVESRGGEGFVPGVFEYQAVDIVRDHFFFDLHILNNRNKHFRKGLANFSFFFSLRVVSPLLRSTDDEIFFNSISVMSFSI